MSGRARERSLVKAICEEHGHIPQEVLDRIQDNADRETIVQALQTKDNLIGSSAITYDHVT
jgi:hypothetical protein